ncbi:hypothetical protein CSW47_05970 [Thermus scotoductus]|uniref:Uncharacterized protein n=1 Tax=Thermus scotoductus TaxID=37636 RepID=A0A430RC81_THESC|nr:hypothetical protein CSW47_05970 [Thermus scotoductus]
MLSVWKHSTPSFFTSQGLGSSSTRRNVLTDYRALTLPPSWRYSELTDRSVRYGNRHPQPHP